jgi:cytochrome c oxidase subunit 2
MVRVLFLHHCGKQKRMIWWNYLLQASPEIPLQSVLTSSSQQADHINRLTNYFFIAAGFILLVVAALTAYVLYRFREQRPGNNEIKTVSKKWEIAMIGVPTVLVGVFLYLSISTMRRVKPDADGITPDVVITGHQWWWEARYPGGNVITANEIHLPVGKKVLLKLLAADVIHDWWVPQFGNKMDMIPTQETHLWVTIKEPGEYYGICSEFCGAQHAHMRIKVVAQPEADYAQWLLQNNAAAVSDKAVTTGARLFTEKSCSSCHRIGGTEAAGDVGPDLTHLASRQTLLAGLLENNLPNLESWIKHPQQLKPGANMPDVLLDDTTAKAIAAYLYSLK